MICCLCVFADSTGAPQSTQKEPRGKRRAAVPNIEARSVCTIRSAPSGSAQLLTSIGSCVFPTVCRLDGVHQNECPVGQSPPIGVDVLRIESICFASLSEKFRMYSRSFAKFNTPHTVPGSCSTPWGSIDLPDAASWFASYMIANTSPRKLGVPKFAIRPQLLLNSAKSISRRRKSDPLGVFPKRCISPGAATFLGRW